MNNNGNHQKAKREIRKHMASNLTVLAFSIVLAFLLIKSGFLNILADQSGSIKILGIFLAGIFYPIVLTAGPAIVSLGNFAIATPLWVVAVVGALGAAITNLAIFQFIKERITDDFTALISQSRVKKFLDIFRLEMFKWLLPFIGAAIIAIPMPDEIGLALLGLSKIKSWSFFGLVYVLHFLGILTIGAVARGIVL